MLNIAVGRGAARVQRRVLGNVQRERRLAHRRTRRNDDQVALLQTRRHVIELAEAGRETRDGLLTSIALVDLVDRRLQNIAQRREPGPPALPLLRDLEDFALGFVDERRNVAAFGVIGTRGNLVAGF